MQIAEHEQRHIRSYVLREGRLTKAQTYALRAYWPQYGVNEEMLSTPDALFTHQRPITLEIGFGTGATLVNLAVAQPHINFLGVEVYRPGIGNLLKLAEQQKLTNLRIAHIDTVTAISLLAENCLHRVLILFPDPWPKRKHQKRRLVNTGFLKSLARCMRHNSLLYLATDCNNYAQAMQAAVGQHQNFRQIPPDKIPESLAISPSMLLASRFALRARKRATPISVLSYLRQ